MNSTSGRPHRHADLCDQCARPLRRLGCCSSNCGRSYPRQPEMRAEPGQADRQHQRRHFRRGCDEPNERAGEGDCRHGEARGVDDAARLRPAGQRAGESGDADERRHAQKGEGQHFGLAGSPSRTGRLMAGRSSRGWSSRGPSEAREPGIHDHRGILSSGFARRDAHPGTTVLYQPIRPSAGNASSSQ